MARSQPRNEALYRRAYAREIARGNTETYAKRVASAEARGKSKQQARGHVAQEHRVRAQRAQAAGRLTEADKRWLKAQQKRIGYDRTTEVGRQRWAAAMKAFEGLSPEERFNVKTMQKDREKDTQYAGIYAPMYGDDFTPLYLSSRSGLR